MADSALDSRSDENVPPLAPVHLPEFGLDVGWIMCPNFGVHCDGGGASGKGDGRYRLNFRTGREICS